MTYMWSSRPLSHPASFYVPSTNLRLPSYGRYLDIVLLTDTQSKTKVVKGGGSQHDLLQGISTALNILYLL